MSLILPFKAATTPSNNAFDFYSGVLAALHEFGSDGIAVSLEVYDSADSLGVPAGALMLNDIVMGPISVAEISPLAKSLFWNKFIVSPLDPACAPLADSLKIIQAPTTQETQIRDLVFWACEERSAMDSLLVVCEENHYNPIQAAITEVLDTLGASYQILRCESFEDIPALIGERISPTGLNRIILSSEREEFVNRITESVAAVRSSRPANLYCPGKVRNFASISDEERSAAGVKMVSAYNIDENDPATALFIDNYKKLYRNAPNSFAFQGYDLTRYFISIRLENGYRWFRSLEEFKMTGLQSDFAFERRPVGFVNTAVRRIEY